MMPPPDSPAVDAGQFHEDAAAAGFELDVRLGHAAGLDPLQEPPVDLVDDLDVAWDQSLHQRHRPGVDLPFPNRRGGSRPAT